MMHMSEFVFCQTQISMSHISAYENDFHLKFEGDLIDHQLCFILNFKFLAAQEPNFLELKFGQNRLLIGFCMYIGPASVFVLYLDLASGLCRAVFLMFLVSPIGLPAY